MLKQAPESRQTSQSPVSPTLEQQNPVNFNSATVNSILIGTYYALIQGQKILWLALALLCLGVFFLLTSKGEGRDVGHAVWKWSAAFYTGVGLLLLNLTIRGVQGAVSLSLRVAIVQVLTEAGLLAMILQVMRRTVPNYIRPTLVTIAMALAWFALLNVVISSIGVSGVSAELYAARSEGSVSRYDLGGSRWQSLIYSSGQLSGLLRWSFPMLLLALHREGGRRAPVRSWLPLGIALLLTAWVLRKCEYRSSMFPTIGAVLWWVAGSSKLRTLLPVSFVTYAVAAPWLFTNDWFMRVFETGMPDWVVELAGTQDLTSILSLSGRLELWDLGNELLRSGKYFWFGQGHELLNVGNDYNLEGVDFRLFRRLSYHHAVYEILFIYGTVLGVILLGGFVWGVFRATGLALRAKLLPSADRDLECALFSAGMVGLTNCHDGTFVTHDFFYLICIISLTAFADARRLAGKNRG